MGRRKALEDVDITGMKFGKLTAIKQTERPTNVKYGNYWLCVCDCGNKNTKTVSYNSLVKGHTKSCGCYQIEMMRKALALNEGEASFNCLFGHYKNSAKRRGWEFAIEKEYFRELTKQNCYYCGKPPSNICKTQKNTGNYTYSGIDRMNPKIGYIIGNVVPCCWECNQFKKRMSFDDFINYIKNIYINCIENKK